MVQGHVDGVGQLVEREGLGNWDRLRFAVPAGLARYIAEKGSIAVDGVSLTVTAVSPANDPAPWFEVGLIPTTLAETGLGVFLAGGTTAAGAGLGAIFGGKKGALIGAAIGGGAGTLYEVKKR